ncbi:docking protein 3-like [Gadus chalcogrammus]|uniref:docking protein 3-like n=1 Tax=Gadus chalcogrammus TaxID=1042646 RepID=UPI0024C48139|nr:docking protein 3-like [Gadus chalcogrammus]
MNVFKEGLLYLHGVKFGKKTWRKIWMIILKPQSLEIGRLEVYSLPDDTNVDMLPPEQDKTKRRVVLLSDCLDITLAPEEACPPGCTAFYLDTTLRTYTLASEDCQEWLLALCQLTFQDHGEKISLEENSLLMKDCDLYSGMGDQPEQYNVTVLGTVASERCLLAGEFVFLLDIEAVFLLDKETADIIYRWPYMFLRRFGIVKGGFCIEAGPQCDSGEGMFSFLSPHGHQVCQAIARHCLTEQEAMGSSTQESDYDQVSPPPPSYESDTEPQVSNHPGTACAGAGPGLADHYYAEVHLLPPSVNSHPSPQHPSHLQPGTEEEGESGQGPGPWGGSGGDGYTRGPAAGTRVAIVPEGLESNFVYSLVSCSESESDSSLYEALPFTSSPTPAPPSARAPVSAKPPRRARLFSKGTKKSKTAGGPVDRSPSGPKKGPTRSFQQKLSKLISLDLAKFQSRRRFGKGKS